jgi:hypothetical protein
VYYPLDYWHQTITVSDRSISVTGTLVDANCYKVGKGWGGDGCHFLLGV